MSKSSISHAANACAVFGIHLAKHRRDVNFCVELNDGSIWIPSTANLRVKSPVYQCIKTPHAPRVVGCVMVSDGQHPSIPAYHSDILMS